MRLYLFTFALCFALAGLCGPASQAQPWLPGGDDDNQKTAQTGLKFLSVSTSPRAVALGNAATALNDWGAAAMFYNPASMARLGGLGSASFGLVQWIADITYNHAGVAINPAQGRYGVFGVSVLAVDYGEFEETIRVDTETGYEKLGSYSPSALAIGIGYAKALSDRFSVGGNVKYVRQDLGSSVINTDLERESNTVSTPAFDFGIMYNTGFRSLSFAMRARNFAPAVEYQREAFELPLNVSVGLSMNVLDLASTGAGGLSENHSFLVAVDTAHPRDYAETISLGGEYTFMNLFSLRGGYTYPSDEQGVSLGGGLNLSFGGYSFSADYAYTQFDVFDNVNTLAIQIGF